VTVHRLAVSLGTAFWAGQVGRPALGPVFTRVVIVRNPARGLMVLRLQEKWVSLGGLAG